MNNNKFQELLKEGNYAELLVDGGRQLNKQQLKIVKERGKQEAEEKLQMLAMEMATKPGYREMILAPVMAQLMQSSMSPNSNAGAPKKPAPAAPTPAIQAAPTPTEKPVETKSKVSDATKATTNKLLKSLSSTEGVEDITGSSTDAEILGSIYKLMTKTEGLKKLRYDKERNEKESLEKESQKRHEELLAAFGAQKNIPEQKTKDPKPAKLPKVKKPKKPKVKKGKATTTTQTPPAATPSPKPSATAAPAASSAASTAAKVGLGVAGAGIAAIAAISIFGETSAIGKKATLAKSGQVKGNDPEPGHFSYGFFGMNSKSRTIHAFVGQHPEFGLTAKPGTEEFNKQWKALAEARPEELYNAQFDWYNKNIIDPLKTDLKSLQLDYGNDDRILAYMADRRVQYGKTMETQALKYASAGSNATEFINRMTDFDLENIGTAFKTYLSNNPNDTFGLKSRIERRKMLAMQVTQDTGNTLDSTSKNNAELWQTRKNGPSADDVINKTNVNMNQQSGDIQTKKEDDRSAYERKKNSK